MQYTSHVSTKKTHQTKPIPGKKMVENNAGGFVFEISDMHKLDRFLILGSEGGTYYVSEQKLTQDNAKTIIEMIKKSDRNGVEVVRKVVDVSTKGRAPKNDPAIFVLALCCAFGGEDTEQLAYQSIPIVCRTGTHLFAFCQSIQDLRGWSRGLRKGVAKYYLKDDVDKVAYQMLKYRQRNGWTHKDVLRLCHANPVDKKLEALFKYIFEREVENKRMLPKIVKGYELAQKENSDKKLLKIIEEYKLVWEMLPTSALNSCDVWWAMLPNMPMMAMVRNLAKMASLKMTDSNFADATKWIVSKLTDKEEVKKSMIHPIQLLFALKTYSSGHGFCGKLSWEPNQRICDAIEEAFDMSFGNVPSTGLNCYMALDVSGSMEGSKINNSNVTAREASCAMAMVRARVEKSFEMVGFSNNLTRLQISPKQSLRDIIKYISNLPFSSTDCSLPMLDAIKRELPVDTFEVYTDNETYAGEIHPCQALKKYRQASGRNAKLVVVGMTATDFTIADPSDRLMMDVVGFDTSAPTVIADFFSGDKS